MRFKNALPLGSWALYDFANTIFSALILTVYFPLYFTKLVGSNWTFGVTSMTSMILSGLAVPFLGAISDQTGKTKAYLIRTTLLTAALLFPLSFFKQPLVLILLFLLASFFYHASLVFYNSLLPVVAPPEKQGFISGLGTGLGYLGVVFALPVAHGVDHFFGMPAVFTVAAFLFVLFALPLFYFVPERRLERLPPPSPLPLGERVGVREIWRSEWRKIWENVKGLRGNLPVLLFLGGNFFAADALNATIFWIVLYIHEVFHPEQKDLILFMMALNASAFLAGILSGWITDRLGAARMLILASAALAGTLAFLILAPNFFWFAAVSLSGGAFAIAGIWTAGRKRLVELAPQEKVGEYFGLYGLTTKLSVIGTLAFSLIADLVGMRAALKVLVFPAAAGCLFFIFSYLSSPKSLIGDP